MPGSVGPCLFRRLAGGYQLTNEWGGHLWLEPEDFRRFISGGIAKETPLWNALCGEGFLRDHLDFPLLIERYKRRTAYLRSAPGLHVVAVTRRRNQGSPYQPASRKPPEDDRPDMRLAVARRVVKSIFDSQASEITIELRGGEPLLNWPAVEFIVSHARSFAEFARRSLRLAMVSNLSLLDDDKLAFLMENEVRLCVPLDGPADLHDRHRPFLGGRLPPTNDVPRRDRSGHGEAARWLAVIAERYPHAAPPEAWLSVTRDSLSRAGDIVAECARLKLPAVFPRPLFPAGAARERWRKLGYSAEEYLGFYADCLRRVLELNRAGCDLMEGNAALLLTKILRGEDPGHTELRSPCGGGLAQLCYDHNGDVFLSDEGRGLADLEGDDFFRIGSVDERFLDLVHHPTVKAATIASDLGAQPLCSQCAYKPFCGVSPVYNYAAQGSIWGRNPTSDRCAMYMGYFDLIFEHLRDPGTRVIFERWAAPSPWREGQAPPPFLAGGFF
ncbi:MAG: hypothetical protein ABII00_09445 [Elusimicrobiota bacterium]